MGTSRVSRIQVNAGPPTRVAVDSSGDLAGIDLQAAGRHFDAAEIDFVDEGIGPGKPRPGAIEVLGPAERPLKARSHVGGNVLAVGVAAGKGEAEVRVAFKMRNLVEKADALLQQAVGAPQRGRLLAAEEVVAGDVGEHAGAHAGLAVGAAGDASRRGARAVVLRLAGLRLKTEAVGQRPAPRLHRLQQNRLLGRVAVGVFDGRIHFVEERERVEVALRVGKRGLVERIAGMDRDGPRHRLRAREMQAGEQHIADEDLLVPRRCGRPRRPCWHRRARAAGSRSRPPGRSRGCSTRSAARRGRRPGCAAKAIWPGVVFISAVSVAAGMCSLPSIRSVPTRNCWPSAMW